MEIKDCYEEMGADYESVLARFGSDKLICKFLKKYFEKNEYEDLEKAVNGENWRDAFMYAHNMKGFGLNLSLTELSETSSILCEALRAGEPEGDVKEMLSNIRSVYVRTKEAVRALDVE